MLLKKGALCQKTTSSIPTENPSSSHSVSVQGTGEIPAVVNRKRKKDRGGGSMIRRKKKRIEVVSNSPLKVKPDGVQKRKSYGTSESDSGSFDGLTWGSPTKLQNDSGSTEYVFAVV